MAQQAKGQGQGKQRISNAQKQIEKLRNVAPARLHAAFRMTGNVNSNTAFGKFNNGQVDIFKEASDFPVRIAENAYNNWLASGAKPVADVYPKAIGLYVGERFPGVLPIKAILAEHSILTIQLPSGAKVIKQPSLTIPAGVGVETRYATADSAGADKKLNETFGPMS
ncbi:hypothetical protein, partial [Hyalangium versicolor]|uniref:hypothetical protein n=1 Tax=Hyalangium versicolor TaxID=2861190 RepID=UPI001CD00AAC